MSCGDPRETDCSEVLAQVSVFLEHQLGSGSALGYGAINEHLVECPPCLQQYGIEVEELQQAIRELLARCCSHDHAPEELRLKVLRGIRMTITTDLP